MAVLPTDPFNLGSVIQGSEPSRTWYIDKNTNRIRGECDGYDAVRQAVDIIMHTLRFKWQIYRPSSGVDYDNLVGLDPGYVSVELQRRILDALRMDTRITGMSGFSYSFSDGVLEADFIVNTVFGDIAQNMEVQIE